MQELHVGDIVQHFKREFEVAGSIKHIYKILAMDVKHTESAEKLVIYQALYPPFQIFARPQNMFYDKVDKNKYPDIKQEYRLEKINPERI